MSLSLVEDKTMGYPSRTKRNIREADFTLVIACDTNTPGEKLTKRLIKKHKKSHQVIICDRMGKVEKVEKAGSIELLLPRGKRISINIAGNSLSRFKCRQDVLDDFVVGLLTPLKDRISLIQSGGQSGIDLAGINAGIRLCIDTKIVAPRGWMFRDVKGIDRSSFTNFAKRINFTALQSVSLSCYNPECIDIIVSLFV